MTLSAFCAFAILAWLALGVCLLAVAGWRAPVRDDDD